MATTAQAAAHIFLSAARFHDLVAQGVITKAERGSYNLDKVREEYIRNVRKSASGHGKDTDGLSKARAELAREQATAVALKNAIARGEYIPTAIVERGMEMVIASFSERTLAIPGKIAASCAMRETAEIEEILRDECHEALDELSRPILPVGATVTDEGAGAEIAAGDDDRVP
jgi:phage terminase Nu1 subunit (DNA packaging protein)